MFRGKVLYTNEVEVDGFVIKYGVVEPKIRGHQPVIIMLSLGGHVGIQNRLPWIFKGTLKKVPGKGAWITYSAFRVNGSPCYAATVWCYADDYREVEETCEDLVFRKAAGSTRELMATGVPYSNGVALNGQVNEGLELDVDYVPFQALDGCPTEEIPAGLLFNLVA